MRTILLLSLLVTVAACDINNNSAPPPGSGGGGGGGGTTPPAPFAQRRTQLTFTTGSATPAVRAVGDVDGDGVADIAVGDPSADAGQGRVLVYSGATGAELLDLQPDPTAGDRAFGTAVVAVDAGAGARIVVGAPGDGGAAGAFYVFDGTTGDRLHREVGGAVPYRFGTALAALGDVDGDGNDDVAVAEPHAAPAAAEGGRVQVYSVEPVALLRSVRIVPTGNAFAGPAALDGGEDLDGDGNSEILVATDGPTSTVRSSADGSAWYSHLGDATTAAFLGDLDSDQVADYAFGYPARGEVEVRSGANGAVLRRLVGEAPGDGFGVSLAAVGDQNGDGVPDLVVGSRAGTSTVVSGADGATLQLYQNGGAGAEHRVFRLGDLDGDGIEEWAAAVDGQVSVFAGKDLALTTDVTTISAANGGTQTLSLMAGDVNADRSYLVAGSFTGTSPGTSLGTLQVPLNFDRYTSYTLTNPNNPIHVMSFAQLDAAGRATAQLVIPPLPASAAGLVLHHAYVVFDAATTVTVSNAVPLVFGQ